MLGRIHGTRRLRQGRHRFLSPWARARGCRAGVYRDRIRECRNRILREDTRMSLDFEVSTIATMTVPDSWRLSLEAPRYPTIAPPVGVTRMSRSVSHPLLRSIHPSPIRLIHSPIGREVQASFRVEGQQQRRQSHPVVRQPFPHGSDSSHKKMPPIGAAANVRLKEGPK